VYGILTTENNVVINGSIECSEAFFGDDCHVTGSVITGGIKTGSGFKARHIEAGESVNIGNNSQVNKIDAVNDVTIGSNSRVRHAISERGTIILAAGAVADIAEAAQGTKTA
jgi:serine acetyltransferase